MYVVLTEGNNYFRRKIIIKIQSKRSNELICIMPEKDKGSSCILKKIKKEKKEIIR